MRSLTSGLLCLLCLGFVSELHADIVVFNVVGTSALTLSGNASPGGNNFPYENQGGAASLTTTYLGTITVNVDNVFGPGTISFQSASVVANLNAIPNLSPAVGGGVSGNPGSAPANYGVTIPAVGGVGALRDISFNIASTNTGVTAGAFAVTNQTWSYNTGNFDVNSPALGQGRVNLLATSPTGLNSGSLGSYSVTGNTATLVLPTSVAIAFNDTLTGINIYTGTITAIAAVPEPSSIALLCTGCMGGIGGMIVRARKKRRIANAQ